ncbi:hypothetical protein HY68_38660 [Streptomyces sp. AcH 505]|nr:hypothetical protein HY68_38660 [Streptomyces sp. AcH 505]
MIGLAQTLRFVAQIALKSRQTSFPMSSICFAFAPFLGHKIKGKLVGIEFLCSLGDSRSLLLEQCGQRTRFFLTALHELRGNRRQSFGRDRLQCRDQIGDIARDQSLDTRDRCTWRLASVVQCSFELIERLFLATVAQRTKRLAVTLRFRPDCGDGNDFLVQPRGPSAEHSQTSHQHHAGLCARPVDNGYA